MSSPDQLRAFPLHPVEPSPEFLLETGEGGIPTDTFLFRADARLDEVVSLALETRGDSSEPLRVASVGASIGIEAVSILSHLENKAPDIGRVSLTGFDLYDELKAAAEDAQYRLVVPEEETDEQIEARIAELQAYGLHAARHPENSHDLVLDARALLRDRHDTRFWVANAAYAQSWADIPEVDLLVCNNVLYHLSPEGADELALGLASHLAERGVMSFGAATGLGITTRWTREIAGILAEDGINPVLFDMRRKAPFAFQREAEAST